MWIKAKDLPLGYPFKKYGSGHYSPSLSHIPFQWRHLRFWQRKYWKDIQAFLKEQKELGIETYPSRKNMFRALELTPFNRVRVVILGQDPYYTKGVADGLAFSILPNKSEYLPGKSMWTAGGYKFKLPPTLKSILREYREDLGYPEPRSGDLSTWARNGVLLVNSIWTVQQGKPNSHYKIQNRMAWGELTAEIVEQLSIRRDKLVFILWGKKAQEWRYMIDEKKHLVLSGSHPSPINRRNLHITPFAGGKYFSKAADYLGVDKSMWRLP